MRPAASVPPDPPSIHWRFQPANLQHNLRLLETLRSLAALPVSLSPADLARIEEAIPPSAVAGDRYAPPQMQMLDSEQ